MLRRLLECCARPAPSKPLPGRHRHSPPSSSPIYCLLENPGPSSPSPPLPLGQPREAQVQRELLAAASITLNLGDSGDTIQVSGNRSPKQAGLSLYLQLPHFNKLFFSSSCLRLLLHLRVEEASYSKSPGEREGQTRSKLGLDRTEWIQSRTGPQTSTFDRRQFSGYWRN